MAGSSSLADDGGTPPTLEVPRGLWRTAQRDKDTWIASALALLELVARSFGRSDLSTASVLDVGCGTKFTKVILERDVPIGHYVGVDTSADVIAYLNANVDDPRFEFHHLDAHNDLYNPQGRALDSFTELPVGGETFDAICLFSVFTHLAPHDFRAMLELLRPCVASDGGLVFSLFVDEGLRPEVREALQRGLAQRMADGDASVAAAVEERLSTSVSPDGVPDFVDRIPDQPLMQAVYSEPYARQLLDGTGWTPVALHPPEEPYIQHYFVCRPT
jgi:SAM-dependent methyltransferase